MLSHESSALISNQSSTPLFPNSINRIIIIDKSEYYLSYKHNLIEKYSDESILTNNLDIGKFYISSKQPDLNGKLVQYSSDENILVKDTINKNILNNDKLLVKKIVKILEGTYHCNEFFKLEKIEGENDFSNFKIIINVKNGISIGMFTCKLKMRLINSYSDILLTCMRYFQNKTKINDNLEIRMDEKKALEDEVIKKYNTIHREIEKEENLFLKNICDLLNQKKFTLRKLNREFNEEEELEVEKEELSKINSSTKKEDENNQSQTLSLSDLL